MISLDKYELDILKSVENNEWISKTNKILNTKNSIIDNIKKIKPIYEKEGLILLGLFGSYSNNTNTVLSDIDIAYEIDYNKFSEKYKDGFSKILRINDIRSELEQIFKQEVDLVPNKNKIITKDILYV